MKKNYQLYPFILYVFFISSCGNSGKTPADRVDTIHINTASIPDTLKKLNEQIFSDPDNASLLHTRANYYLSQKEYLNSYNDMMQVLNIDSSKAPYYLTLSDIYFYTKKTENSKRALEKVVELDGKNMDALLKLAQVTAASKNPIAIQYYKNAIQVQPNNTEALYGIGKFYQDTGDWENAIDRFTQVIQVDPQFIEAYFRRGLSYQAIGNSKQAVTDYQQCLRINPNYEPAKQELKLVNKLK